MAKCRKLHGERARNYIYANLIGHENLRQLFSKHVLVCIQ